MLLALVFASLGSAQEASGPLDRAALVGGWSVTMVATHSSCPNVAAGEVYSERWTVSRSDGALVVDVEGGGGAVRYRGDLARGVLGLEGRTPSSLTTLSLRGTPAALSGVRVVANDGPCAIVYSLDALKG